MKAHVQKCLLDISGHSTGVCLKMGEKGAQIIQKVGALLQTIIEKWSPSGLSAAAVIYHSGMAEFNFINR